jgi:hypothetical protein
VKTNILKLLFFSFLLSFLFAVGCTEPPVPSLNSKDRRYIDSLYKDSIQVLRPIIDSLCELNFDDRVNAAVDSMMTIRLEEIRKQLARIRELKRAQ